MTPDVFTGLAAAVFGWAFGWALAQLEHRGILTRAPRGEWF